MEFLLDLFSTNKNIFDLFFKLFAVVISILYLVYALIVFKQARQMLRAIEETGTSIVRVISFVQIIIAIFLIFISFVII